jgi:hypothetical protein
MSACNNSFVDVLLLFLFDGFCQGGGVRRDFVQRFSTALHGTWGSYLRDALQEGVNANFMPSCSSDLDFFDFPLFPFFFLLICGYHFSFLYEILFITLLLPSYRNRTVLVWLVGLGSAFHDLGIRPLLLLSSHLNRPAPAFNAIFDH